MTSPATFANYPSLVDRVVFITGGGSGIGAAMVEAFAGNGAQVAFVDIQEAASQALCARLQGARHAPLFLPCDLIDIAALHSAMGEIETRLGPMSVLVNNAANDERHDSGAVTPDTWDRAQNLNLRHQFFAAQAAIPQMRTLGHGSIINFSSIAWMFGGPRMVAYATAKAAVIGLTNSLARENGQYNIRVNALAPGAVVTERQRRLWLSEVDIAAMAERQCIHTSLYADEIARAALFLAADDSRMITKQCLTVDAGMR